MNTSLLGKWGEALAADYLRKRRYKIIAANYSTRFGEIDLIAERRDIVAFVEVKLRKDASHGDACEFVTPAKQKKIRMAAEIWALQYEEEKNMRFDVAGIYAPDGIGGAYTIEYIEGAF